MDVGPDGTLYVAGVDPGQPDVFLVAVSTNAQDSSVTPSFDYVTTVDLGGSLRAGLGLSSPNPDGFLGQVWVAAGPAAGLVYLLCSVDPPGDDPMDVMFARSTDSGRTWSPPLRVHHEVPGAWQWFGTMSVSPEGRIDVVWNDTRDTGAVDWSSLYLAISYDGGRTWLGDVPLSAPWNSHAGWPVQRKIGDYYHMVSDRVGASLAWASTFNGEQDIWFLRIFDYDCNANGIGDHSDIAFAISRDDDANGVPDECERPAVSDTPSPDRITAVLSNAPNPFNPTTTIVYEAPAGCAGARLDIVDVAGRLVRSWSSVPVDGRRSLLWDGRDANGRPVSSGVYVCRLVTAELTASRRLVLAR
jgi:hypothetical protein